MAFNFTKMFRSSKKTILEGKAAVLWQLDALDGWFQVMGTAGHCRFEKLLKQPSPPRALIPPRSSKDVAQRKKWSRKKYRKSAFRGKAAVLVTGRVLPLLPCA